MYRIEIYQDTRRAFRWRLRMPTGVIVASSEGSFPSKEVAMQAIQGLKMRFADAEIADRSAA